MNNDKLNQLAQETFNKMKASAFSVSISDDAFVAIILSALEQAVKEEREQVSRIATFAAEVVNAKKDPVVICRNCGEVQPDQIDRICTTCQRRELRTLKELHSDYATLLPLNANESHLPR